MKSHVEKWIEEAGKKFLHDIDIINSPKVLDFRYGSGNYTIPVVRIVGFPFGNLIFNKAAARTYPIRSS